MGIRQWATGDGPDDATLEPHEVFTPTRPPLDKNNVYIQREKAQGELDQWIKQGSFPVVSGDYGVGKTSLGLWYFQKYNAAGKLLYVPSAEGVRLEDVFRMFLEKCNYSVTVERSSSTGGTRNFGIMAQIASSNFSRTTSSSATSKLIVESPTDQRMLEIINSNDIPIIIDEMHKSSDEFKAELASFLKSVRMASGGKASGEVNIVLIGTIMDSKHLSDLDRGLDRFLEDVKVLRMRRNESEELIRDGFDKLQIDIEDSLVEQLQVLSGGAPSVLQSLCLHTATAVRRRVGDDNTWVVETGDVSSAVNGYMNGRDARMAQAYIQAVETQGRVRYRKQILHAIALQSKEYATMDDIRKIMSKRVGREIPATSISGSLQKLKSREYGQILINLERDETGESIQNLTTFRDPMMKSYVRFLDGLDRSEVVDLDESLKNVGVDDLDEEDMY